MERTGQRAPMSGRIWLSLSIVVSVGLMIAGIAYYHVEKNRISREKYDEIASVAEMKVSEIESWRMDRLDNAGQFSRSLFTRKAIRGLLKGTANPQLRRELMDRLDQEGTLGLGLYSDAFVLDTSGRTLVSVGTSPSLIDSSEKVAFYEAVLKHKPVMTDLFIGTHGIVHIDAMSPMVDASGATVAVVVLRSDAGSFLYPLIDSWPIPSRSAETVLLERLGDHISILNNPRSNMGKALSFRMPITPTTGSSMESALGEMGMFEGKDQEGVDVLADIRPVPNTPWFMISKVDASEILAEANFRGGVVILTVILFIVVSITATAYAYRHRQAGIYREMYQAEIERKKVLEEFKTTLHSIGDAVITTNTRGQIKYMNPVAERLTGWSQREASEMALERVFRIVNEDTRSAVESPVQRVLKDGTVVGLADHTLLVSRDGVEYPIADSGAPIRDESGVVTGVVLIFRDQTRERAAEREVKESEARLIRAELASMFGSWELHLDSQTMIGSLGAQAVYGLKGGKFDYSDVKGIPLPEYREKMDDALKNLLEKNEPYDIEFKIRAADSGDIKDIHSIAMFDREKRVVSGVIQDITERKRYEEELTYERNLLKALMDNVPDHVYFKDKESRFLRMSRSQAKRFGLDDPSEAVGKTDFDFFTEEHARPAFEDERKVMRSGVAIVGLEEKETWPDGRHTWVSTTKVPLRNARGEIIGTFGVSRDITERMQMEEALAMERNLLRTLIDNLPDYIYAKDTDGRLTVCNTALVHHHGASTPGELVGKTDLDFYPRELAEQYHADEQAIIRSGQPLINREEPTIDSTGNAKWDSTTKVPLCDQQGKIIGLVGISRDITERKRVEEELRNSRERYRLLHEYAPVGILLANRSGEILEVNPAALQILGSPSAEATKGINILTFPPLIEAGISAAYRRCVETGQTVFGEYPYVTKWGKSVHTQIRFVPIFGDHGQVTLVHTIVEDVTERKNAENALRESEEKFRSLVEGLTAAISISDGKRFFYANPAALKMLGYSFDEISRLSPADIIHPEYRELVTKRIAESIAGKDVPRHYEFQLVTKSGEGIWVDFSTTLINHDSAPTLITSAYDISDRKKLEDQLLQAQKMEGIGRLAGGVAHDYNNMLGVIIGYSDLIMRKMDKSKPMYHYIQLIASAAKRGADITRQLLAFARREIVSPRVLDPNKAIESLQKILQRLIGENIRLTFLPEKSIWNIKIDPTQLDQILFNLATNSRDAIDNVGTISIETSNISIDQAYAQNRIDFSPGEYVVISFTDTGKGMSKETLTNIFEPFFTTKSKGHGTGLGLATVYGIVKQNGGSIHVYSELGVGTTFKIYLPRYEGEVEGDEAAQVENAIDGTDTVLIVEDQPDLLELAKNSLEEYGYKVLTASSPEEGIKLSGEYIDEIHVLLTDVIMPVMNGKELRDKIQTIKPDIKTIFMSGYTADVIAHQGVLDHGVDFIQKPFSPYALAKKVHDALNL
ncbi:MAG TPA: PAS domain S-box protein [Candidatus Acidoferrales bacterium]|nr:PAS domain S-box protein [Candidatus Acidoferrales bacterium]